MYTVRNAVVFMVACFAAVLPGCGDRTTSAKGPVAQNGGVVVVYPNGGEVLRIGDTVKVRFGFVGEKSEIEGFDFMTELYFGGKQIIQSLDCCSQIDLASEQERTWVVPDSIWELDENGAFTSSMVPFPRGSTFKVRIREYDQRYTADDYSDGYFTIAD